MYAGQMVEYDDVYSIFRNPAHPYTEGLLKSIPKTDEETARFFAIEGSVPDPSERKPGCRFCDRCLKRMAVCDSDPPVVTLDGKAVRCWLYAQAGVKKDE
jgi:oligopeptide/dipeptide ABC transporter ATP-binding protein